MRSVAFADAAVVAVVSAVVGELDQSADIDIVTVIADTDSPGQLKQIFGGAVGTLPDERDPFVTFQFRVRQSLSMSAFTFASLSFGVICFSRRSSLCSLGQHPQFA